MSFKNILGQEIALELLTGYIKDNRLEGGYLFTGSEGIGKKLTALNLAKAVNCLNNNLDPCDQCESCVKIDKEQHPDVRLTDATTQLYLESESNDEGGGSDAIKINHIRQLQKELSLRAYEGKRKVFIIDNAHNLTASASNALLKVLEEPPAGSLLILITDKPNLLFKTIISRCKIIKFKPLKRSETEKAFKSNYGLDSNLSHFLAYFSEGRIGRALELKDTDIFREKNSIIDRYISSGAPHLVDSAAHDRLDLRKQLNILTTWFRDIYLLKAGLDLSEMINLDRRQELSGSLNRFTFVELDEILNSISDSIFYLERNINTKLIMHNLGSCIWKG